jgi:hypothetical protein
MRIASSNAIVVALVFVSIVAHGENVSLCDEGAAYNRWMTELSRRFDTFTQSLHDVSAQRSEWSHGDDDGDVAHDFNDVLDLRLNDGDVLEGPRKGSVVADVVTSDDDVFFHEHVSGGRIVKEDLMVLHLRAFKKRDMHHKHTVFHDRVTFHRDHVQNETKKKKVRRFVGSVWSWWMRWVWRHCQVVIDILAFVVLIVVPWRMVLEMRDPKGMMGARASRAVRQRSTVP